MAPYWHWSMRPQKAAPRDEELTSFSGPQSSDPLDEHHTYLYHLFLKYGVVDEVLIYSKRKARDEKQGIPDRFEFYGKPMRLVYGDEFLRQLQREKAQIFYARERFNFDRIRYPQHVQIVKSLQHGFPVSKRLRFLPVYVPLACRSRKPSYSAPDLVLAEGPYNAKFVQRTLKTLVWPSLSGQSRYVQKREKEFDWVVVSSFNPRKRIVKFCRALIAEGMADLKGCILARAPKHEREREEFAKFRAEIQPRLDVHLRFNAPCREKMIVLGGSRVFVSTANEDSGPRSVIEAGQAAIPVLAMKNHGSASFLVRPGVNGETTWFFKEMPKILKSMLADYGKYDCSVNKDILSEEKNFLPIANAVLEICRKKFRIER